MADQQPPGHWEHHERHPRDRLGRPLPRGSPNELPLEAEPDQLASSAKEALGFAALMFDSQRFYEAHEFLEYIWKSKEVRPKDRDFWRGLTQLAAAYCHVQRGNEAGALTLFARARSYLKKYPRHHLGVDARAMWRDARRYRARVRLGEPSEFPHFHLAPERPAVARRMGVMGWVTAAAGVYSLIDAAWLAARPKSWAGFWGRQVKAIRRRSRRAKGMAALEAGFGALMIASQLRRA